MGPLRLVLALPALVLAVPAAADPVARWQPFIAEASLRFGIPEAWIARVMRAESGGKTHIGGRAIRSPKGAMGLMQLMPGTWGQMRARLALGTDPDDPRDNILAGTFYLRLMYDRFGYPGLFGAYNAGPARYAAFLAGRSRLPAETIGYLKSVAPRAEGAREPAVPAPPPTLFAVPNQAAAPRAATGIEPPVPSLFAVRKEPQ
ncbi:lytic transglycosylase domain-containing protein [Sphingomonas soli]|uniref:lytic transglycosylase domain-containing protein n=1 Tax=Sphingomonas soli TaxID=266127 RepID=UPI00082A3E6B|nr:lytic transglycosylase domain-containing protein [Sphingomonas soli]